MATWGQQTWGYENWGTLGDQSVELSSISLTLSQGTVVSEGVIQIGWGGDTWSENEWGDLSGSQPIVVGQQLNSSIGTSTTQGNADIVVSGISASYILPGVVAGASADVVVSGISLATAIGVSITEIGVAITGIAATGGITAATIDDLGLIGSGWGRNLWGSMVWGDAYSVQTGSVSAQTAIGAPSVQTDVSIAVQGFALSYTIGDEESFTDVIVSPSGITLSGAIDQIQGLTIQGTGLSTGIGLVDLQAGGNVFIQVDEHTINTGIGSVDIEIAVEVFQEGIQFNTFIGDEEAFSDVTVSPTGVALAIAQSEIVVDLNTPVDVTGSSLAIAIGDEEAFTNVTVEVTGTSMTYALGDIIPESKYSVDGIPLSGAINSVTINASAVVVPTGMGLTVAVANPNIIAWAEVDVGTPVTWSPVDLAA